MIEKSPALGAIQQHMAAAPPRQTAQNESTEQGDSVSFSSQSDNCGEGTIQNSLLGKIVPMGQCEIKPELKPGTMAMIKDLHEIQSQGQGKMPLKKIFDSFGLQLTAEQQQQIDKRGDLELKSTAGTGGTFVNKGDKVKLSVEGADIIIPREVSGNYDSTDGSFAFHFAPKKTISACKLFLCADLENLAATDKRIDIDMAGALFDSCIVFEQPK